MTMKKGIISISTIAVVVLGVFFAVRFIGGRESVSNVNSTNGIVQSNNVIPSDNNEALTIGNTQEKTTSDMDAAYINDKTNVGIYTVKKNDTVFSIVKTFMPGQDKNKTVEFIKDRNNINQSYTISEGQKIVIPYEKAVQTSKAVVSEAKITNTTEYTVKKKDTLTSIAKINMPSYNVKQAIGMLKETNKITDEDAIKDGSHLYIPK